MACGYGNPPINALAGASTSLSPIPRPNATARRNRGVQSMEAAGFLRYAGPIRGRLRALNCAAGLREAGVRTGLG